MKEKRDLADFVEATGKDWRGTQQGQGKASSVASSLDW